MRHLLRASRTAAAVLAVVVIDVSLTVHTGAAGGLPMGSSSPSPSATATASATPCPTDLTGSLCLAMGAGAPTPTPSPSPTASASPKPTASSGGGKTSGGSGGAGTTATQPPASGAPAASHGAPPAPTPSAATVAEVAATFHNAPFLGQLLDILRHPTAAQRPDLRHFRPAPGAAEDRGGHGAAGLLIGSLPTPGGTAGRVLGTGLALLLLLLILAVLLTSPPTRAAIRRRVAAVWRLHPSLHRLGVLAHNAVATARQQARRLHPLHRLHRELSVHLGGRLRVTPLAPRRLSQPRLAAAVSAAAVPVLMLGAVMAAGGGRSEAVRTAAATRPSLYLRGEMSAAGDVQPVAQQQGAPAWTRLVTIERGLAGQQDQLAAQEAAIQRLAVSLAGTDPDREDAVQVGDNSEVQRRDRLAELVAAHSATQAAYQASLQAEYDLYRAAAQDPAQRAQLTAAAAAAPPQAKEAVAYNLSLVQTQLSQEQAIAAAEGKLQELGSLSGEQLDAMRHHQAFIAPEIAPVSQPFGPTDFALEPPLSFGGTFYPHFHTGLDIAAPLNTPVHAAADGVVLLAAASVDSTGALVGYGNYVVIAHPDGFVTLYGHLDSVAVKAGQVVHQGEIVGLEGSTGWSTGPHVHFEIRHDGQFLDPAAYVGSQLPASQ